MQSPLQGNLAPIWTESDAYALPVVGELPRELRGTLYRNGPNPQFTPTSPHHHWFGGDGMVHAFTLEDGRVRYRNRWVRTPKWLKENAAGRPLIDVFGPPDAERMADPEDKLSCVANTNILAHAGRLLALEEGHPPVEMDAATLATVGFHRFGGDFSGPFTAHPKVDPHTGELLFFGYFAAGAFTPDIVFGTVDAAGQLGAMRRFAAPYASMVHDFCVTERHVLFPILPLTGSLERAMRGAPPFAWEPDLGAHVGILPRGAPAGAIRWFRASSRYVFHVMNAWEDGARIHADVAQYEQAPLFPFADGRMPDPARSQARLCRWTFDLDGNSDAFASTYIDDLVSEFPRLDQRYAGLPYRHGYYACHRGSGSDLNAIAHIDHATGRRALHVLPDGDATSEPVFVPRAPDAAEGDGFLLAVIWREAEKRSDLVVLDAGAVDRAPLATAQLSHRVPFGFHGNFVAAN